MGKEQHLLFCMLITGWASTNVKGTCELSSRIKRNDSDVTVLQTDQPCTLTFTARNNKQVVVVMYDTRSDCVEKATVAIYDGESTSGTLLTNRCQAYPWSFASRTHSLTLTPLPVKPLRPFNLDIHSFDTIKNFTEPIGTIRSERYPGSFSGISNALTTPNNFHSFYNILMNENVSISIHFKELFIEEGHLGHCADFVIIHGNIPSTRLCSQDNLILPNITTFTSGLSLEFQTDSQATYTGFEASYITCFDKKEDEDKTQDFYIPMYQLGESMRCVFEIHLRERRRLLVDIAVFSNQTRGKCNGIIKIVADDIDSTETMLAKCALNTRLSLSVELRKYLRLVFTSANRYEHVEGNFTTETLLEESTISSSSVLSSSILSSTDNAVTDIIPVIVPVTLLMLLAALGMIVALLYKRGILSRRLTCESERAYEDTIHYTPENQYTDPSTTPHQDNDNTVYQNEKFEKEGREFPEQSYSNVEGHVRSDTYPAVTYEMTEEQYESHRVQNIHENEHQYTALKSD